MRDYGEEYKPPFEITKQMIHDMAEIMELVRKPDLGHRVTANPILRRGNRIRTIRSSLAIKQNTLSLEQVTAILNGERISAPSKNMAGVKKAYDIYEHLKEQDPKLVGDLLTAHGILTRNLAEESGIFPISS